MSFFFLNPIPTISIKFIFLNLSKHTNIITSFSSTDSAKVQIHENKLIDGGISLRNPGVISYCFDIVYICSFILITTACFSDYFWLCYLLVCFFSFLLFSFLFFFVIVQIIYSFFKFYFIIRLLVIVFINLCWDWRHQRTLPNRLNRTHKERKERDMKSNKEWWGNRSIFKKS